MTTATFEQTVIDLMNTAYDISDFRYENGNYRSETTGSDLQLIDRDTYTQFARDMARDNSNPEPDEEAVSEAWSNEHHLDVDGETFAIIDQR